MTAPKAFAPGFDPSPDVGHPLDGPRDIPPSQAFLNRLEVIINAFLEHSFAQARGRARTAAFGLRAVRGSMDLGRDDGSGREPVDTHKGKGRMRQREYVFVRVPSRPGFLLEAGSPDEVTLWRASQVQTENVTFQGETARPMTFVVQSPAPLAAFRALDEETVRTEQGRTLLVEGFARMVLDLVFEELG